MGGGLRLGTIRRPPRGIPRSQYGSRDFYDVWLPDLAPSAALVKVALHARDPRSWRGFVKRYRRETKAPATMRLFGLLAALSWFVVTVLVGLAIHMLGVYSVSVAVLSRIPPLEFFRRVKTAMLTAFSTSSSNATLPTALRVSEENLGVPREVNGFVLTVGATANQNGTALYEGVTVLFLAQLAQIDLTLGQQVMVVYLAMLGSIGTAGVPSGSIPLRLHASATPGTPSRHSSSRHRSGPRRPGASRLGSGGPRSPPAHTPAVSVCSRVNGVPANVVPAASTRKR